MLIEKVRELFRLRPKQYHCLHSIAEELRIKSRSATDCINVLKQQGFLKLAFKDICIHSKMRHSFYEKIGGRKEIPKAMPKKITARLTPKPEISTKTVIITDKNKNRVIYKKTKIVEIDKDIVHIVEV